MSAILGILALLLFSAAILFLNVLPSFALMFGLVAAYFVL